MEIFYLLFYSRELREEHQTLITREAECAQRRKDAEKRLEACEAEAASARSDLRLALQRIEDLQAAMMEEEEMEDCDGGSAEDGSDDRYKIVTNYCYILLLLKNASTY